MKRLWIAGFFFVWASWSAQAAVIATYDFTGALGNQASTAATGVAGGLAADALARGPGVAALAGLNSINSDSWTTGALDLNDYYGFTLTPGGSTLLNVDSITFSERRSGTGIASIELRSSLDGFIGSLFTFAVPDDTNTRRHTAALGSAFDGLTGAVTFRLYGFNAEGAAGSWRLGISSGSGENPGGFPANVLVDGAVNTVPEPASFTILLTFAGALGGLRCCRREAHLRRAAEPRASGGSLS